MELSNLEELGYYLTGLLAKVADQENTKFLRPVDLSGRLRTAYFRWNSGTTPGDLGEVTLTLLPHNSRVVRAFAQTSSSESGRFVIQDADGNVLRELERRDGGLYDMGFDPDSSLEELEDVGFGRASSRLVWTGPTTNQPNFTIWGQIFYVVD